MSTPRTDKRCDESQKLQTMAMRFAWMCDHSRILERELGSVQATAQSQWAEKQAALADLTALRARLAEVEAELNTARSARHASQMLNYEQIVKQGERLATAERERDEARATIERLEFEANPIHSCGPTCQRPACVMRRERDRWRGIADGMADALYDDCCITKYNDALIAYEAAKKDTP